MRNSDFNKNIQNNENLNRNKSVILEDVKNNVKNKTIVKPLSNAIFLKNKEKRESSVHHADYLVPRYQYLSNSDPNGLDDRNQSILKAASSINMIQQLVKQSIPEVEIKENVLKSASKNMTSNVKLDDTTIINTARNNN